MCLRLPSRKAETDLGRVQDLFKGDAIAKTEGVAAQTTLAQSKTVLKQAEAAHQQTHARLELLGFRPGAFRQKIAVKSLGVGEQWNGKSA